MKQLSSQQSSYFISLKGGGTGRPGGGFLRPSADLDVYTIICSEESSEFWWILYM